MRTSTIFVMMMMMMLLASCAPLAIIPAAAADYTLDVFGNANMDNTIDEDDIAYVEGIIDGTNERTELADANYDGEIDKGDITHIEQIISGEEKELTIIDSIDRTVTVKKPIERVIALGNYRTEAIKILGGEDKIVGISSDILKYEYYYPELLDKLAVGTWSTPDHEAIIGLKPDIVITSAHSGRVSQLEEKLEPAGITVIGLDFYRQQLLKSEIEKLGYILDKRDEAEEYNEWRDSYEEPIRDFVDELIEDEKPRVFLEWGTSESLLEFRSYGEGSSGDYACTVAGGRNMAAELPEYPIVDCEWVLEENPDIIIKYYSAGWTPGLEKWGWHNTEEPEELITDIIERRPGWDNLTAVKDDKLYVISTEVAWGPDSIVGCAYLVKWLHPEFDIDPKGVYREYLDRFMDVEYPEDMIFGYPEPS